MSGHQPTDYETYWNSAEEFVGELQGALAKEAATIRETELDAAGSFKEAYLEFMPKDPNKEVIHDKSAMVFVDRIGRIVTPPGEPYTTLCFVTLEGETQKRTIVRHEPRYQGDQVSSLVHYPESLEGHDAV